MEKLKQSKSGKDTRREKSEQIRHTADVVAVIRFQEGKKKNPLIYDPFAHLFVSPQGEEMLKAALKSWPFFSQYLMVRAKFFDDHLADFCQKGDVRQIVILGAGNDMRAARLSFLKERKIFEVDFPDQITYKKGILKRSLGKVPENVVYVGTDIKNGSLIKVLSQTGFVLEEKSAFIMEGLIYYLSAEGVDHLFEELSQVTPLGNLFLLDQISQDLSQKSPDPEKSRNLPYPEDVLSYLTFRGFKIRESTFLGNLTEKYLGKSYPERWWAIVGER